jgi:hypothetical protein
MADMWTIDPYTPTGTGGGYLPTGTWGSQPEFVENTWWNRNFGDIAADQANTGGASSGDLVKALQAAGKAFGDKATADKDPGFLSPQSAAPGSPMRRVSIDQLAQMLNKQRDTLYNSALTPGTKAEPVIPNRTIGLLGF